MVARVAHDDIAGCIWVFAASTGYASRMFISAGALISGTEGVRENFLFPVSLAAIVHSDSYAIMEFVAEFPGKCLGSSCVCGDFIYVNRATRFKAEETVRKRQT